MRASVAAAADAPTAAMAPTLGRRSKRGINNMPPSTIAIMSGSDITSPWFTTTLTVTASPSALTTASTVERVMRQTSMPASTTLTPNSSAFEHACAVDEAGPQPSEHRQHDRVQRRVHGEGELAVERNRLRRRIGVELEVERGGEAAAVEQVAGGPEVHVGVGEEAGAVARDHERDHDGDDRDDAETAPRAEASRAVPAARLPRARPPRRSDLTRRAEEGGTARHALAHDDVTTARARLAFPRVDVVELLVLAGTSEEVDVLLVGERRAPVLHRVLQRLHHRPVEAAHLLRRERVTHAVPPQAGTPEDLVAVDVPDAGDELLVHQQRFQLRVALPRASVRSSPTTSRSRAGRCRGARAR